MGEENCTREYRVGDFRIVADRAQVFRGDERVRLPPKAVKLLVALIERRGRVVPKGDLISLVWPGLFVEEGNVKYQISAIRQQLGHNMIETVGKIGYQFGGVLGRSAAPAVRTNLPGQLPELVGRAVDLELLEDLLEKHRLVTIHGTGGVGKTSLARCVGRRMLGRGDTSVLFLDVAATINADAIAARLAAAIEPGAGRSVGSTAELVAAIGGDQMLVILDGCENVLAAAAEFARALLEGCPKARILATSRIPLHASGERTLPIDPLSVAGSAATAEDARRIPAVALMLDCAEAADARFVLDDLDVPKAIRLCRQLDGLPLAIELVGRRLPVLCFDVLGEQLAEFSLQCADPLRNALDVSWALLTPRGQAVLPRLSAFAGSFDMQAAAAVGDTVSREDLLGAVTELADHSLLAVERGRMPRYRLLDTTRAFARARLGTAAEREVQALAARHYARRMTTADEAWELKPETEWREALEPDLDSLRGALAWAVAPGGDPALGLALAGRSVQLWYTAQLFGEGRHWLETALAAAKGSAADPAAEARVWRALGALLMMSDPVEAGRAYGRASRLYRLAKNPEGVGSALVGQGVTEALGNDLDRAEATLLRARKLLAPSRMAKVVSSCEAGLALVYGNLGRTDDAYQCLEAALEARRRTGDPTLIAMTEANLAELAFMSGEV